MMFAYPIKTALAASTFALAALATPAAAQVSGGTQGGVNGQDVSVRTCGEGRTDGDSVQVAGCAEAEARNGGEVDTNTRSRANQRRAMQRSTATARDEDERARSRTHTVVRQGQVVRSRTSTMYRQRGERPVRETTTVRSTPQGTTTRTRPPR